MDVLISLLTLTAMETVLGIDNVIFISILVAKLPEKVQARARTLGLGLALFSRLALLFSLKWIMGLTQPWFTILTHEITGREFILLLGGLFLIGKSTLELHEKLEGPNEAKELASGPRRSEILVLLQIAVIDIVFSLDSVITAVGMAQQLWVMVAAMLISVGIMMAASGAIHRFVTKHPTIKILALSFLLLIGVMLVMEGWGSHVEKSYIYFAMAFSLAVEFMNMRYRKKGKS